MKTALLFVIVCVLVVATALFAAMFRRDKPILGLAGLTAATAAAVLAVVYAGVNS